MILMLNYFCQFFFYFGADVDNVEKQQGLLLFLTSVTGSGNVIIEDSHQRNERKNRNKNETC